MASDSSLFAAVPIWSVISQLLAVLVLLVTQRIFKRRVPQYFELLNEFMCCFVWVWWSLETTLISFMSSWAAGSVSVFVRLLVFPYLSQAGRCNPCDALFLYLAGDFSRRGNLRRLYVSMLIGLVAAPVALVFCHYCWTLLGLVVSNHHYEFIEWKLDYFLSTRPQYGVLCELVPSFIMFLPLILSKDKDSPVLRVLNSLMVLTLIYLFSDYTGAFMNPMVALASTMYWHSLSMWDYLIHFLVFWIGPFIGTWAAAKLELHYQDNSAKYKPI